MLNSLDAPHPICPPLAGQFRCTRCQAWTFGAHDDVHPFRRLSVCSPCQEQVFPAEALGRWYAARGGYPPRIA